MQKLTVVSFLSLFVWFFFSSENYQDFLCLICCSGLTFIFAYIFCKSIDYYIRKKQCQQITNEIENLLIDDKFLTILRNGLHNTVDKQVDKQLHTNTTEKKKMNKDDRFDLYDRLLQMNFDEVIENSDLYFDTVKITNFDLINHQCKGTELSHSKEYYQTIFKEKLDLEILMKKKKVHLFHRQLNVTGTMFLLKKKIIDEHFIQNLEKKKLFCLI